MIKKIMLVISVLTLVVVMLNLVVPLNVWWREFWAKKYIMNFDFYGKYNIDTSVCQERMKGVSVEKPFTYCSIFKVDQDLRESFQYYGLKLSDSVIYDIYNNHKNEKIIISVGRKIQEITYKNTAPYQEGVMAEVTFNGDHQDDTIYIYFTKEKFFIYGASYYLMDGKKKSFFME